MKVNRSISFHFQTAEQLVSLSERLCGNSQLKGHLSFFGIAYCYLEKQNAERARDALC